MRLGKGAEEDEYAELRKRELQKERRQKEREKTELAKLEAKDRKDKLKGARNPKKGQQKVSEAMQRILDDLKEVDQVWEVGRMKPG